MNKEKQFLYRALHYTRCHDLQKEYEAQGYVVRLDVRAAGFQLDLLAERGDDKIAFEIKVGDREHPDQARQIIAMRDRLKPLGIQLRLIRILPPLIRTISIDWLEESLPAALDHGLPAYFRTKLGDVRDVEFDIEDFRVVEGAAQARLKGHCRLAPQPEADGADEETLAFAADLSLDMAAQAFSVRSFKWLDVNVYFRAQIDKEVPARAGAEGKWQLAGLWDDDDADVAAAFDAGKFYSDAEELRQDIARALRIDVGAVDLDLD